MSPDPQFNEWRPEREHRTVLTEQTAKRYKLMQAVGALLVVLGAGIAFLTVCLNTTEDLKRVYTEGVWYRVGLIAGISLGISGTVYFAVGKFLAWWHHG